MQVKRAAVRPASSIGGLTQLHTSGVMTVMYVLTRILVCVVSAYEWTSFKNVVQHSLHAHNESPCTSSCVVLVL